jgi:DNA-binding PadR family transcriptional regulator
MISQEVIKGTLKPLILKLISENGRMYGYQITQMVKDKSQGEIQLTEGALYPALHKLVEDGYLITETENIGKRERKYYRLSDYGNKNVGIKLSDIQDSLRIVSNLFDVKPCV